jgi:acetyltransferase-like isoleucine patch superfamily enzyme
MKGDERDRFEEQFLEMMGNEKNPFHPLVFIKGDPKIGENTYIGLFSEINANGAEVNIGRNCDIASFVSINVSDSHRRCIGISRDIERMPITIGDCVFIGSHCFVKGGARIGHHSVVAAGTIVDGVSIPPYSLVYGNPMQVRKGYYRKARSEHDTPQQADH